MPSPPPFPRPCPTTPTLFPSALCPSPGPPQLSVASFSTLPSGLQFRRHVVPSHLERRGLVACDGPADHGPISASLRSSSPAGRSELWRFQCRTRRTELFREIRRGPGISLGSPARSTSTTTLFLPSVPPRHVPPPQRLPPAGLFPRRCRRCRPDARPLDLALALAQRRQGRRGARARRRQDGHRRPAALPAPRRRAPARRPLGPRARRARPGEQARQRSGATDRGASAPRAPARPPPSCADPHSSSLPSPLLHTPPPPRRAPKTSPRAWSRPKTTSRRRCTRSGCTSSVRPCVPHPFLLRPLTSLLLPSLRPRHDHLRCGPRPDLLVRPRSPTSLRPCSLGLCLSPAEGPSGACELTRRRRRPSCSFRPSGLSVSGLFILVITHVLGSLLHLLLPKAERGRVWAVLNPGPMSIKETTAVVIMATTSFTSASAVGVFAVDELYYDLGVNYGLAIFTLIGSQFAGYGIVRLARSSCATPAGADPALLPPCAPGGPHASGRRLPVVRRLASAAACRPAPPAAAHRQGRRPAAPALEALPHRRRSAVRLGVRPTLCPVLRPHIPAH